MGVVVSVAGVLALYGAVRLTCAQAAYFRIKYGGLADVPAHEVDSRAETVWRRYPSNYYLALHLASGWWASLEAGGDGGENARQAMDRWVRRGLEAHPLLSDLHLLQARLLAVDDPRSALAAWDAYVDHHYWNAFNQAMRVDFHVQAQSFTTASDVLTLLRGRPYHDWASARFREALHTAMQPPTRP